MKLIDDFFEILKTSVNGTVSSTTIKLNPAHIVYTGHFPGHPVTPGVIQVQIIHELIEGQLDKKVKLKSISMCKFLKVLNPEEMSLIVVHIELNKKKDLLTVNARSENGPDTFFKLNACYQF